MDYEEFLDKFIPSRDMRDAIRETRHIFTEWERATIIWNSRLPLHEKHKQMEELLGLVKDSALIKQIEERLAYDQDAYTIFEEEKEGYVYILNSHEIEPEEDIQGFFADFEMAYESGRCSGFGFDIRKHQIIDEDTERIKNRRITASLLEPDEEKQVEERENPECSVAGFCFDVHGNLEFYWSDEPPKDRYLQVNTLSNHRFENRYVVFPRIFETNEKVHIVGMDKDFDTGWVAPAGNAEVDYSDACLRVDYWEDEHLMWSHRHILPIYLERVHEDLCDSFRADCQVIVGHDYGNAVWFRTVDVQESDKILQEDIRETGKEISVSIDFFNRFLKKILMVAFDPNMPVNRNRYTYAFSEEGRYLDRFEELVLEHNFLTYDQMTRVVDFIDDCILKGNRRYQRYEIEDPDSIQLLTFTAHIRQIMEDHPELNLISVMS